MWSVTIEVNSWIASGMMEFLWSHGYAVSRVIDPGSTGIDILTISRTTGEKFSTSMLEHVLKEVGFHETQFKVVK